SVTFLLSWTSAPYWNAFAEQPSKVTPLRPAILKATLGLTPGPTGPGPTSRVPLHVTWTLLAPTVTAALPAVVAIAKLPAHSVVLAVMTIPLVGLVQVTT